jgi:hypothetical protein
MAYDSSEEGSVCGPGFSVTCWGGGGLERGKPTCQIGKTLQVLQALGLAIEATPLSGNDAGGKRP